MTEENILKKIQSKKTMVIMAIILILVFLAVWFILINHENNIEVLDAGEIASADADEYDTFIRNITLKPKFTLSGWVVKQGEEVNTISMWIVFRNVDTGVYYRLPTTLVDNDKAADYYDDGLEYKNTWFQVSVPYMQELENGTDYEIYALLNLNGTGNILVPFNTTVNTWLEEHR